ncbi:MAG: hypothetical protein QOE14_1495 [Humisphaera sp.]|nr:hypothetical protein [Humisphaera sp.]
MKTFNDKLGRSAVVVAGGLLVIGLAVFVFSQARGPVTPSAQTHAFFSIDDGKTWFPDDGAKLAPFDKDGKPAVRAYVFRSPKGTEFVNHLERFKPDAKRLLDAASKSQPDSKGPPKNLPALQNAHANGREVKRPGDATWVGTGNLRDAAQVMTIKGPDGATEAEPVEP